MVVGHLVLEIPLTEMRYWLILFSTSCFANILGLNISAAFNSAVTIYILIPLLIIPQLLLSGVVIQFDRFNPQVGEPVGVPLMGDMMASRWAFEAYMVTQFRDNPYEKELYEWDKTIAISDFKRMYLIPELESKLSYCLNNRQHWRNQNHQELSYTLTLLRNEITNELRLVGEDKLPEVVRLEIGRFDSITYDSTQQFLSRLRNYYTAKLNQATTRRDAYVEEKTNTPEKELAFEAFRKRYANKEVGDWVKNVTAQQRIIEYKGRFIQKYFPIYMEEHRPKHVFDYTANFYQPTKHFAGRVYNTFYFNLVIIWLMTLFLFIALYFDWLRKLIVLIENRKYKRRDRN